MRIVLTVFLLSSFSGVFAQFDTLLNKPYPQKLNAIHRLYMQVIDINPDSARAYGVIGDLRRAANRVGDRETALEADLLEALFDYRCLPAASLRKMHEMVRRGKRERIWNIACRATYVIARQYWDGQEYEQAFRWFASLDSLLAEVTVTDFPNKVGYLKDIGDAYYRFGDYHRAIAYFTEATTGNVPEFFESEWKHAMNNMGLAYQQLDSLELSDRCFQQLRVHNAHDTEVWEGIASGNLGYNQYLRGNYGAAIPLFQRDIDIAIAHGDYGLAAGSAIPLADIRTRQGLLDRAKPDIDSAYAFIHRSGQTDRLRLLYPVMNKWYAVAGHPEMAARYMDSTLVANERYQEKFNALRLLRASQEIMASQREAAMHQLRATSQRKINERNLILGSLALCLLLGAFWSYKQRKANELALKDRDLQLLEADRELKDARIQLNEFARAVAEKNQLLEAHDSAKQRNDNHELIEQLNHQVVLTDDDWTRFSTLFGKVYPGFQHQLKVRYPTLTPAEIRCLSMEKLRFSNKEMAALQGISTSTVMATKHRIRKKLGIASHAQVIDLIQSFPN